MKPNPYKNYNIYIYNSMLIIIVLACLNIGYSTTIYNYYELAVQKWCSTD